MASLLRSDVFFWKSGVMITSYTSVASSFYRMTCAAGICLASCVMLYLTIEFPYEQESNLYMAFTELPRVFEQSF